MKKLILALGLTFPCAALADAAVLEFSDAYVRKGPPGQRVTAAFFSVRNNGQENCNLTGVEAAIAERVEMHRHDHSDGMMRMRKVDSVELASGESTEFSPGGFHLMLFDLNTQLNEKETVSLTFTTEQCGRHTVEAAVKSLLAE